MSARKPQRNGNVKSTRAGLSLKVKPRMPSKQLRRMLAAVYNAYQKLDDRAGNAQCREDFVFHMSDWEEDLEQLAALYKNPQKFDKDTAEAIVYGFVIHVSYHLAAAKRCIDGKFDDLFADEQNATYLRKSQPTLLR